MSWIVQNLWSNRERIKHSTGRQNSIAYNFAMLYGMSEYEDDRLGYDDPFIESDEFNDLLVIEKAIDELKELGLLSPEDLKILYSIREDALTRNQKYALDQKLYYICERIAYYLGGYFTDDGYIHYMTHKYKLNEAQVSILKAYMKSQFKNKILSKGYRIENANEETRFISAEV